MLSMTKGHGGMDASYYAGDSYLSEGNTINDSEWLGKGAQALGLQGQIEGHIFDHLRTGAIFGKQEAAGENHTPGWDLTASAPKSVSILALVTDDKRLIKAHRAASKAVIQYVEQFATTRQRVDGKIEQRKTENLIVGRYTHDTSRSVSYTHLTLPTTPYV